MTTLTDLSKAKITVNQLLFKHLYYRYNAFIAPVATILVSILLVFFIVIPQMQSWFALKDTMASTAQSLQIMHKNLATISGIDSGKLDAALAIATKALPPDKDFEGIITSLQNAAAAAGTSLGDYSFTVGDLSGATPGQRQSAQLPVQFNISLVGGMATARYFVAAMQRQLPLSDVLNIQVEGTSSITVTVVFYYANLPKISFAEDQPLPELTNTDQKLLNTLAVNNAPEQFTPAPTPSVVPTVVISPTATPILLPTVAPIASPSGVASPSAQ